MYEDETNSEYIDDYVFYAGLFILGNFLSVLSHQFKEAVVRNMVLNQTTL